MDYIKNHKGLFSALGMTLLMAAMFLYYSLVLTPQLETLQCLEDGNYERASQLNMLEQELSRLADRKEENIDIEYEINALENKIPSYGSPAMIASDFTQYLSLYKFENPHVEIKEDVEMEEEKDYKTIPVRITFESNYDEALRFVEMLNRSTQVITIDYFAINNDMQEAASKLVSAEIVILVYYREKEGEEVYSNFTDYTNKKEDVFEKMNLNQKEEMISTTKESVDEEKTTFNLHLSDVFRSGDNYSFSAYAPNEEATYVGLTSTHDTKMVITILENSYKCLIEDAEGNKSEKQIDTEMVNPNINITSQIQKVMEDMPSVSIYIKNYTPNVININMKGTCLEHINIYNENNKLVEIGEKSGRISLQ